MAEPAPVPEGLTALLERELAGPEPSAAEPTGNELLPGEEHEPPPPPEKTTPPPPEKPPEKTPPPEEKDPLKALRSQLAPDFSATPEKKPIDVLDVPDMPENPPEHITSPKAKEDYRKWRETQKGLLRQLQELRQKSSTPDTELQTRYQALQEDYNKAVEKLDRNDLINSPKFEREKLMPRERNFESAAKIVKDAGGDPLKLRRALMASGPERTEALDELVDSIESRTQREKFGRLIDAIDDQTLEINSMIENSRKNAEEYRKQELIERHKNGEKSVEQMKTLLSAARDSLENEGGFWILRKSEDPEYDWYNKEIDVANQASEELLLKAAPEQAALGAVLAPHAIRLFKMLNSERAARLALENEIKEMREAGGDLRTRRTPGGGEAAPDGLHGLVRKLMSE